MGTVTGGGSLRSLTPGYIPCTPPACEGSPAGCEVDSPYFRAVTYLPDKKPF